MSESTDSDHARFDAWLWTANVPASHVPLAYADAVHDSMLAAYLAGLNWARNDESTRCAAVPSAMDAAMSEQSVFSTYTAELNITGLDHLEDDQC